MSEEERVTTVSSTRTSRRGRTLNSARTNHFVIDEPPFAGGPGEAVTPEESFLAGIAACGVSLVEKFAEEEDLPLGQVDVQVSGVRDVDDPSEYRRVEMEFSLEGVSQTQAQKLVASYEKR